MDTVESMKVFVRVAQRQGFAAAGRDLGISPAAVTKHVSSLEARLSARLFDRNTRNVSLTEAGRVYLERCLECLQSFEDAEASVNDAGQAFKGLLRVTAPVDLPRELPRVLERFMAAYPNVVVDLRLSNRPIDLIEEGVDVAVRVAVAIDGQFVARKLMPIQLVPAAAPELPRALRTTQKPEDLAKHRALTFSEPRPRDEWDFEKNGKRVRVKLDSILIGNNGAALVSAAVAGIGVVIAPSFLLVDELLAGRLEPLLLDWPITVVPHIYALYPHRRFVSPKVRAFVDSLREVYGDGSHDLNWAEVLEQRRSGRRRAES